MKSGAEPHTPLFVPGSGLLDRVEYRPVETPEEKNCIYLMRYRAYLHGGLILPSESRRVSDQYDDAPNALTFGVYVDGELSSSLRLHVLTSEWRMSFATELFGDVLDPASIKARFSSMRLVLLQTPRKPSGFRSFPT